MVGQAQHIIILGPAHPLRPGGITTFNERLCRAFIEEGHQCQIWSFSLQYPGFLFPGTSQFTDAPAPADITIRSIINSINPLNWIKVGRALRRAAPQLVVVRFWIPLMGPCLGTILRLGTGGRTRVVCIADNVVPHEKRPGDVPFTRYFLKAVHHVVVMSRQVLADLHQLAPQKPATLVPHPLYDNFGPALPTTEARSMLASRFGLQLSPEQPVLLFFGLIRAYKGLDLLLQALPLVQQPVKLLVAGEFYDDREKYTALLQQPGMADKVLLHDQFVANEDVRLFACAADCVVQPYRHATQSGVTPVAYHFEVPMIVTNVGGLPEMVPHGKAGLVCEPTPQAIAAAIDAYFQQGKAAFMPGLLAEKKQLSWDKLVQTLLQTSQPASS